MSVLVGASAVGQLWHGAGWYISSVHSDTPFSPVYFRGNNRKKANEKHLRCYPACSLNTGHRPSTFCGRSVAVKFTFRESGAPRAPLDFRKFRLLAFLETMQPTEGEKAALQGVDGFDFRNPFLSVVARDDSYMIARGPQCEFMKDKVVLTFEINPAPYSRPGGVAARCRPYKYPLRTDRAGLRNVLHTMYFLLFFDGVLPQRQDVPLHVSWCSRHTRHAIESVAGSAFGSDAKGEETDSDERAGQDQGKDDEEKILLDGRHRQAEVDTPTAAPKHAAAQPSCNRSPPATFQDGRKDNDVDDVDDARASNAPAHAVGAAELGVASSSPRSFQEFEERYQNQACYKRALQNPLMCNTHKLCGGAILSGIPSSDQIPHTKDMLTVSWRQASDTGGDLNEEPEQGLGGHEAGGEGPGTYSAQTFSYPSEHDAIVRTSFLLPGAVRPEEKVPTMPSLCSDPTPDSVGSESSNCCDAQEMQALFRGLVHRHFVMSVSGPTFTMRSLRGRCRHKHKQSKQGTKKPVRCTGSGAGAGASGVSVDASRSASVWPSNGGDGDTGDCDHKIGSDQDGADDERWNGAVRVASDEHTLSPAAAQATQPPAIAMPTTAPHANDCTAMAQGCCSCIMHMIFLDDCPTANSGVDDTPADAVADKKISGAPAKYDSGEPIASSTAVSSSLAGDAEDAPLPRARAFFPPSLAQEPCAPRAGDALWHGPATDGSRLGGTQREPYFCHGAGPHSDPAPTMVPSVHHCGHHHGLAHGHGHGHLRFAHGHARGHGPELNRGMNPSVLRDTVAPSDRPINDGGDPGSSQQGHVDAEYERLAAVIVGEEVPAVHENDNAAAGGTTAISFPHFRNQPSPRPSRKRAADPLNSECDSDDDALANTEHDKAEPNSTASSQVQNCFSFNPSRVQWHQAASPVDTNGGSRSTGLATASIVVATQKAAETVTQASRPRRMSVPTPLSSTDQAPANVALLAAMGTTEPFATLSPSDRPSNAEAWASTQSSSPMFQCPLAAQTKGDEAVTELHDRHYEWSTAMAASDCSARTTAPSMRPPLPHPPVHTPACDSASTYT